MQYSCFLPAHVFYQGFPIGWVGDVGFVYDFLMFEINILNIMSCPWGCHLHKWNFQVQQEQICSLPLLMSSPCSTLFTHIKHFKLTAIAHCNLLLYLSLTPLNATKCLYVCMLRFWWCHQSKVHSPCHTLTWTGTCSWNHGLMARASDCGPQGPWFETLRERATFCISTPSIHLPLSGKCQTRVRVTLTNLANESQCLWT